jgi:hypothetical protein
MGGSRRAEGGAQGEAREGGGPLGRRWRVVVGAKVGLCMQAGGVGEPGRAPGWQVALCAGEGRWRAAARGPWWWWLVGAQQ